MLKDTLDADLKAAMLARDSEKVDVLKGLKSAILYAEVAAGKREEGLSEPEIVQVLSKEAKKRQDSVDLYLKGDRKDMADKELREKTIIETYLPEQMSETEVAKVIDTVMQELQITHITKQDMGKVIGAVKAKTGPNADGSQIAKLVQARLQS